MACYAFAQKAFVFFVVLLSIAQVSVGSSRKLAALVSTSSTPLKYHNGVLLQGNIPVSILWYGKFAPVQKSIISDFFISFSSSSNPKSSPSVSQWWSTINKLYMSKKKAQANIVLSNQVSDEKCSLGKSLKRSQIALLAKKARAKKGGIAVVLTAQDVTVEGFCMSSCGFHGSNKKAGYAYIWVGNSAKQCPGQCAWPFHQPIYGPQTPPLVPPNADVGVDGMVINLGSMIAGTVTNPFGNGFFQGPKEAPLEAATACPGVYAKNAYPGYAGDLLVDKTTGASFNANGASGRKYLLPALFDPQTSTCSPLV